MNSLWAFSNESEPVFPCDFSKHATHRTVNLTRCGEQCPDVAPEEFPAPIGKLLGLMITSSETGRPTVDFEASGRYANPMETLHGGVLCDLADAAMGVAYRSTLAHVILFTELS
jgi:hypothetical protein